MSTLSSDGGERKDLGGGVGVITRLYLYSQCWSKGMPHHVNAKLIYSEKRRVIKKKHLCCICVLFSVRDNLRGCITR